MKSVKIVALLLAKIKDIINNHIGMGAGFFIILVLFWPGLSVLSVISLLMGLITDLSWLSIQGAAAETFSPVALAYAVEMFPPQKRVMTIGFISTGLLTI